MKFFKEKPQKAIFVAGFVFVLLITIIGVSAQLLYKGTKNVEPDLLATVAGEKIYNKDLDQFIFGITMGGSPEAPDMSNFPKVPRRQFLDMLVEYKILEKESIALGVMVTDSEIAATMKEKFSWMEEGNALKEYVGNYQKYLLLKEKADTKILGSKEGFWIMARNDVYTPDVGIEPTEEQKVKIAENKEYTKKFITGLHEKLKAGAITIEQAAKQEQEDPFIGKNAPGKLNIGLHSAAFTEQMFKERVGLLSHPDIFEKLSAMKEGEFTDPVNFITQDGLDNGWYILYLSKTNVEPMGKTYQQWLDERYIYHKVSVHLEESNE